MKNLAPFRLRRALLLGIALVATSPSFLNAQDNTGNKPEMAAPNPEVAAHVHAAKVPSTSLTITLIPATPVKLPAAGGSLSLGNKTLTLSPADVSALPHQTVTVVNGHTKASETYSGVPIAALLARLGVPFEKANEHTLLKTYLIAEGTDGYKVLVSACETLGAFRDTDAIVADTLIAPEGSKPLIADGAFKLVIPGDKRPQRWVQNLKSVTFKSVD